MSKTNEVHWDLSPNELAGLFMSKGWKFGHTPVAVLPKHIMDVIEHQLKVLVKTEARYTELGRFVVYKDQEFPNSYEIMLKVGYVSVDVPEDLDAIEGVGD